MATSEERDNQKSKAFMSDLKMPRQKVSGLQLHYTSSRYGFSGHPGFQTRAMSSAIRPEEQRAIERLGIYQPPWDCPVEPDHEQINELFPVSYRSAYLETGRLALVRSAYVGKDYTGRWGNYFVHAILIDKLPRAFWPVDLYEWDGWISSLHENEDVDQATYQLPVVSYIPDKTAFAFTELQEFLKEEGHRSAYLGEMIQAVFLRKETSRSLVIREEFEVNGLFWIACLQKSFPATCQNDLGCSSYQFDPRACLEINATRGDTDFSLGENERKYQFYVFDFIDGAHSNVGDSNKEYASVISTWMHEEPERLESFYPFADQFAINGVNSDLLLILRLYRLSIGDDLFLNDADLINILSFINSSTKKEYLGEVLSVISSSIRHITKSQNPEYISQLVLFFINGAEETGKSQFRERAYQLLLRLVDNCIFEKGISVSQLDSLRSRARSASGNFDEEFSRLFLSDQHLSKVNENVDRLDDEGMSLCLNELISALRVDVDEDKLIHDGRLYSYIKYVVSLVVPDLSKVDWLFSPFGDSIESHAMLCVYICKVLEQLIDAGNITRDKYNSALESFSLFLFKLFQSKGDMYQFKVINHIKHHVPLWRLLEEEYKQEISKNTNPISFYKKYYQNVLEDECEFSREFRPDFAEILWESISRKQKLLQAVEWIKTGNIGGFSNKLLSAVCHKASESISFDSEDQKADLLSKLIDNKIADFHIVLRPNRSILRQAILLSDNENIKFDEQPIEKVKSALSGIDRKTYAEFTTLYLPRIMAMAKTSEQHGSIVKTVILDRFNDVLLKSYKLFFNQGEVTRFNIAEYSALKYWISLTAKSDDYDLVKDIRVRTRRLLAMRIARLNDKPYKALMHTIEDKDIKAAQKAKLNEIYRQVDEINNTFFSRVGRHLSKGMKKLIRN